MIQSGGSLLGTKANHSLTPQEMQIIDEFNSLLKSRPYRLLPMSTQDLAKHISSCFSNSKKADEATGELVKEFQNKYTLYQKMA